MRKKLVAGNWKMHGSLASNAELLRGVLEGVSGQGGVDVAVCVPFPYLAQVGQMLADSAVSLGSQDVSRHDQGAYTGEVSGAMLKEFGCRFAIVGHSERRTYHGESSELVGHKAAAALRHGLTPIVCVGETLEQRQAGQTREVVCAQLDAVLTILGPGGLAASVLAYEPVWAIGTGLTASPDQAQEVHAWLRQRVAESEKGVAEGLQILYGGSVKADNASKLFSMADIDGGLIGGAALVAKDFVAICAAGVR